MWNTLEESSISQIAPYLHSPAALSLAVQSSSWEAWPWGKLQNKFQLSERCSWAPVNYAPCGWQCAKHILMAATQLNIVRMKENMCKPGTGSAFCKLLTVPLIHLCFLCGASCIPCQHIECSTLYRSPFPLHFLYIVFLNSSTTHFCTLYCTCLRSYLPHSIASIHSKHNNSVVHFLCQNYVVHGYGRDWLNSFMDLTEQKAFLPSMLLLSSVLNSSSNNKPHLICYLWCVP